MTGLLKKIYHETLLGKVLIYIYHKTRNTIIPDAIHIKNTYQKKFGKNPDLTNPKSLNEKILWLKLNDRTSLHTICADKYAVREYIIDKIGAKYLVPLYFETLNPSDVNNKTINTLPCIIKANHDSDGGIFVHEKRNVNWQQIQKALRVRLRKNYYPASKEWQYKNIKPRIIVEKLLVDKKGNIPFDYKIHCFNGKVRMIQVDLNRGTDQHYRNWYSKDWTREPYKWSSPKGNGVYTDPSEEDLKKPETLTEMIKLSEILSKDFIYVRVDWYDVDGSLYFGELTFHHDGGYQKIIPEEWDLKLGQELNLHI